MTVVLTDWLVQNRELLIEQVSEQVLARSGAVFRAKGPAGTQEFVGAILHALHQDLTTDGSEHLRTAMVDFMSSLKQIQFSFQDLRLFAVALRQTLLTALEQGSLLDRLSLRRLEDWLHQVGLQGALYFIVQREEIIEEQAGQLEIRLAELQTAYAEQSRLLDIIREISIPIAPIFDGILVVPLVGAIDDYRAQALMERLLEAIVETQAEFAILDISGVPIFDTSIAQRLLMTARAAGLLGTQVVVVGLSAETAQTIIHLGINLLDLVTKRNLQEGLAYALAELRLQVVSTTPAALTA